MILKSRAMSRIPLLKRLLQFKERIVKSNFYEEGGGRDWGIWNSIKKEFQFGIREKSPMLAEAKLFKKIRYNAYKYRFETRPYPTEKEKALGFQYGPQYGGDGPPIPEKRVIELVEAGIFKPHLNNKR